MAFGFQIRDRNGNTVLDQTDTTMRAVHVEYIPGGTTRTFSVPNFDSNNGTFYWRAHLAAVDFHFPISVDNLYDSIADVDYAFPPVSFGHSGSGYTTFPSIETSPTMSWNNSTKRMTVTTTSTPQRPDGGPPYGRGQDHLQGQVVFLEYA